MMKAPGSRLRQPLGAFILELGKSLALQPHHLVDSSLVAVSCEFRVDEGVKHLQYRFRVVNTAAEGDEVGVVMFLRHGRGEDILGKGATDAVDLVGADGDPDACTAAEDTEVVATGKVSVACQLRHVRVVYGSLALYTEVINIKAPMDKMVDDFFGQGYRAVIIGYYYFHTLPAFGSGRRPHVLWTRSADLTYIIIRTGILMISLALFL